MTALEFVLVTLGAYRATRFIVADDVTRPIREWVSRGDALLGKLISCHWCFGFWVSLWIVLVLDGSGESVRWPAVTVGALSAGVGILGEKFG